MFQAVRPWSRALSVHQGKGFDAVAAKIGAAMEAVESASAEAFDGEIHLAAFDALPRELRPPRLDDYAAHRNATGPATEPLAWTPIACLGDGAPFWAPWRLVSLDLTQRAPTWIERTSNGLAAAFAREDAILAGLCEVLERDAVSAWLDLPAHVRTDRTVELDETPALGGLRDRAQACGIYLAIYALPCVVGWPVIVSELYEPTAGYSQRGLCYGSACRPTAAAALDAAVTEAAQSRLTAISAARDDILPGRGDGPGRADERRSPFAPPLPPGRRGLRWNDIVAADPQEAATIEAAVERLHAAGFHQVGVVDLPCPTPEAKAVKVVVPGLGTYGRRGRAC